jgi:hypothetical protein
MIDVGERKKQNNKNKKISVANRKSYFNLKKGILQIYIILNNSLRVQIHKLLDNQEINFTKFLKLCKLNLKAHIISRNGKMYI